MRRKPIFSLLLSRNDLEAVEIAKLAATLDGAVRIVDLGLKWGEAPDRRLAQIDISALAPTVIMVECPCPAFEQAVRHSGRTLYIVDHHLRCAPDGTLIDRRSDRSALEQVAHLLRKPDPTGPLLDDDMRLIASNDSGYWRGLLREIASRGKKSARDVVAEASAFRARDIAAIQAAQSNDKTSAADIVQAATEKLRDKLANGEAVILRAASAVTYLKQPCLYLVKTTEDIPFLSDAIYEHHLGCTLDALGEDDALAAIRPDNLKLEICILRFAAGPPDRLVEMFYSSDGAFGDELVPLVELLRSSPSCEGATLYGGAGRDSSFLGIESGQDISSLVDIVLGERIHGARPLASYCSQVFQFVRPTDPKWVCPAQLPSERWAPVCPDEQTLAYFLPAIRDRLKTRNCSPDNASDPAAAFDVKSWELKDTSAAFTIHWSEDVGEGAPSTLVPVTKLRMHLLAERMVALEWIYGGVEADGRMPFWRKLMDVHHKPDPASINTVADLLNANEALRFVASPFVNADKRRLVELCLTFDSAQIKSILDFGSAVTPDQGKPSGWFKDLANVCLKDINLTADTVTLPFDARARSVHSMVPYGNAASSAAGVARQDAIFARLVGVDSFDGGGDPYDPAFTATEMTSWRYRRFASWGTHFAASGYSFALLAYGSFAQTFLSERRWFENKDQRSAVPGTPATGHVQSMYWTMFLLTMLHNAVFDGLAEEHTRAVQRRRSARRNSKEEAAAMAAIRDLRGRLTDYLASLWFENVSPELQGEDLYRLMLDRSGARARFERLRTAIADADAIEADRQEEQAETRRELLQYLGLPAAALVVLATVVPPALSLVGDVRLKGTASLASGASVPVELSQRTSYALNGWAFGILAAAAGVILLTFALRHWIVGRRGR